MKGNSIKQSGPFLHHPFPVPDVGLDQFPLFVQYGLGPDFIHVIIPGLRPFDPSEGARPFGNSTPLFSRNFIMVGIDIPI